MKKTELLPDNGLVLTSDDATTIAETERMKHLSEPEKIVQEMAHTIAHQTLVQASRYLELCKQIRVANIDPATVRIILQSEGFNKARISEINRVSNMPDDQWKTVEAARIGFKSAVDLARGSKLLADATQILSLPEDELATKQEQPTSTPHTTNTRKELGEHIRTLAAVLVRLVEKTGKKKLVTRLKDTGAIVTVTITAKIDKPF